MSFRLFPITIACVALAGCNLGLGDPTDSSFSTPSSSGTLNEVGSGRSGSDVSGVTGNVYGYQVGSVSDDGLQGFAGIASGASVTPITGSGTARYDGQFEVAVIDFIMVNGTQVSGQSASDRGSIALTADLDAGTLTGNGVGLNGGIGNIVLANNVLTVDGTFSGETLRGTVTYDGVSGPLRGLIGSDEVIGAFHGHTDRQVHAGGFIAN